MVLWFEVPPLLSAHCEHWGGGYSVQIVWNKPPGMWTAVEVNVSGRTLRTGEQEEQQITVSGFQPATAYQVSLAALSGAVRRPEPFVFLCHTDPRGKSRCSLVCFTQSDCPSGLTERQVWCEDWCLLCIWFHLAGVIAGSVIAVLIVGVLLCIAVFVYYKRPDIIRLVLPLWLTYPPQVCSCGLFFSTAGESSTVVPPNSWIKSRSESTLMYLVINVLSHPFWCITSWALVCISGLFLLWSLPPTSTDWVRMSTWVSVRNMRCRGTKLLFVFPL